MSNTIGTMNEAAIRRQWAQALEFAARGQLDEAIARGEAVLGGLESGPKPALGPSARQVRAKVSGWQRQLERSQAELAARRERELSGLLERTHTHID